jgi:lysophospholipase L1-like esterase
MIAALAQNKKTGYLNGCHVFTKNNKNVQYFLEDGVHISNDGYARWAVTITHHISTSTSNRQ